MKKLSLLFCLLITQFLFAQTIVKGPYLQIGTSSSMIIRWETNIATDSKVAYGTNSLALTSNVTNAASVISHSLQITGLAPLTKYYYSIGTTAATLQSGSGNYFLTSPIPGTEGQYRFWVVGDCGNASTNQTNCKNQYLAFTGTTTTNGWLLLGDNAYSSGTNTEYNTKFFNYYQNDIMKNAVLWPTPGNHDYNNGASTATTVPYYSIFSTPTAGEAGGQPSGNPAYYSYDYGNIHFLSLDSYGTVSADKMYDTLGAQTLWIKNDLANTNKRWKVAYWHHPPYTMGSHNSDSESDLVAVHTKFIRILERLGVDLILCGHSHLYERSKLMNGHYGNEASFNASTHNLSTQSGLYDGSANSCPYIKDSVIVKKGVVYVVSGSAGQLGGTQGAYPHNAMHYSNASNGGSLVLDINSNRLDSKWICADGVIRDKFTMFKDVNVVKIFTVSPTATTNISASWPGNYVWSNAATTRSIAVTVTANTTFWVKDPNNCVADTFKIKVLPAVNFTASPSYCAGNPIPFNDLSTNSPIAWSWSVNPAAGVTLSSPTSQNPLITFTNSGTYSVSLIANNSYGPGIISTQTVFIGAVPILTTTAMSNTICVGETTTLTVTGANTYTWGTSSNLSNIAVSPILNSVYTVSATAVNGCTNAASINITVNPNPTVTVNSATICSGNSAVLSANGASSYSWSTGPTSSTIFVNPLSSAAYIVTGTSLTCSNTQTSNVTVNPSPTVTAISSNSIICEGEAVTITVGGANTYSWNTGGTGSSIVVSPTITTTYTVNGIGLNNCTTSTAFTQSVTDCTNLITSTASNSIKIFPNPNSGAFNIEISAAGNYELQVTNLIGQIVFKGKLISGANKIDLKTKSGIYYYSILENKDTRQQGKLVIE